MQRFYSLTEEIVKFGNYQWMIYSWSDSECSIYSKLENMANLIDKLYNFFNSQQVINKVKTSMRQNKH